MTSFNRKQLDRKKRHVVVGDKPRSAEVTLSRSSERQKLKESHWNPRDV